MAITLILILLITLAALPLFGMSDIIAWLTWGMNPDSNGLVQGYIANNHEHPPGLTIILWSCFKIATLLALNVIYIFKTALLLAVLSSTWVIYQLSGKNTVIAALYYLSQLYMSICMSYIDIFFCCPVVFALYYLTRQQIPLFAFFYTMAACIKYPALIISPFLILYIIKMEKPWTTQSCADLAIKVIPPIMILIIPMFAVFGMEPLYALKRCFGYLAPTMQALNANFISESLLSYLHPDGVTASSKQGWSLDIGSFTTIYLLILVIFIKGANDIERLLLYAILGHMAYFIVAVNVHENHLFLSTVLAFVLAAINGKYITMAININLVSIINIFSFYGVDGNAPAWKSEELLNLAHTGSLIDKTEMNHSMPNIIATSIFPIDMFLVFAIFNVCYFVYLLYSVCITDLLQMTAKNKARQD